MANTSHASQVSTTQDLIGATRAEIADAARRGHINTNQQAMLDRHAADRR